MEKKKFLVAANWKMHKTIDEGIKFFNDFVKKIGDIDISIMVAPPFTAIYEIGKIAKKAKNLRIGAQNMFNVEKGAYTGEIAAPMLLNAGASFVILGHSERRQIFGESDEFINKKVLCAFSKGLQPILCVGETLEERQNGKHEEVVRRQIESCLLGASPEEVKSLIVAYEPLWAIGTGEVAGVSDIKSMHKVCKDVIEEKWGKDISNDVAIQYGGSVNENNVKNIVGVENVGGFLIGGASLEVESFFKIVSIVNESCTCC